MKRRKKRHISPINKPVVFITMGDPAGIGPEIIIKSIASPSIRRLGVFVIVGDSDTIKRAAPAGRSFAGIVDPGPALKNVRPGKPTDRGAAKALRCLSSAVELARSLPKDVPKALVTAPLSKERIARISPGFVGHTEYLSKAYRSKRVAMVLVGRRLKVVPVTRHIPLSDVPAALTRKLVYDTLMQVIENRLVISDKKDPVIGICALNPHCGENGRIGREEIDIISPAVRKAGKHYKNLHGPISADTIFYRAMKKRIDIIVSMYHDQCLAPFKMVDFDTGVNMTLGLGVVRTSPDHGTAFDIAGTGTADPGSMKQAIRLAVKASSTYLP